MVIKIFIPTTNDLIYLFTNKEDFDFTRQQFGFTNILRNSFGRTSQIRMKDKTIYLLGWFDKRIHTLSHELNHVCLMVFEDQGIDPRDNDGEEFCHLQDSLMMAIIPEDKLFIEL